jgi:hypothetical protein
MPCRYLCARRYFEPSSTAGVRHQSIQEPPAAALKFFRQGSKRSASTKVKPSSCSGAGSGGRGRSGGRASFQTSSPDARYRGRQKVPENSTAPIR